MKSKSLRTLALAAALAGLMTVSAHAASIGGATVTASDVNFRTEADTGSSVYTQVAKDTVVVVGEKVNDSWYKVVYRGTVGYISSQYLSFSETLDGSFGNGLIKGDNVRMRSGASTSASILGTYNNRTQMTVLGVSGNWYKVSCEGVAGYVHSDYFALNGGFAEYSKAGGSNGGFGGEGSGSGQLIVDTAMNYMGVPYVWGGTSASGFDCSGFDCSGFVYYVYKENGYSVNRTAASIYENGVYVEKSELQPGDAVCFSSASESIGHVGIYIGDGQFIHASSGAGSVIISDLSSTYYLNHYVGARRIV